MKKILLFFLISYLALFDFTNQSTKAMNAPLSGAEAITSGGIDYTTSFDALSLNTESQFNNIVVFIRFQDESSYQSPYTLSEYKDIFNGLDQVSLRDYFLEVSYNQLTIDSYFIEQNNQILYVDDINPRDYYRPYDPASNPMGYQDVNELRTREHALLKRTIDTIDAYQLLDPSIELDTNNDQIVDSLTFMVSGEDDGWRELFWPHKWELSTYYNYSTNTFTEDAPTLNGFHVLHYTFNLMGNTKNYIYQASVGILAHETFHLLSAEDLYHYYAYEYIDNVGDWGLMDNTTSPPSHMLGYMKEQYGQWIPSVNELTESGQYILYPMQDAQSNIYKIDTGYSNEYVYLEYRDLSGFYESMLPSSGLLTYRIDGDFTGDGNSDGYYQNGEAINEVFVFRPGIEDTLEPIEFPSEPSSEDYDGFIDLAALSNFNTYQAAGADHDILLFHSDGSFMDLEIFNAKEENGYVVFDVFINVPEIELVIDEHLDPTSNIVLLNSDMMDYSFKVDGIGSYQAYYTLDGTIPSINSMIYNGPVSFNGTTNHINVAIYDGTRLVRTLTKTYTFADTVETSHNGYGDNQNITWVIQPTASVQDTTYTFSSSSEIEPLNDEVLITNNNQTVSYDGTSLSNLVLNNLEGTTIIQLLSDQSISNFYGFSTTLDYIYVPIFTFNGEETITLELEDTYLEQGGSINAIYEGEYYFIQEGTIDTSVVGEQYIYYHVYNLNDVLVETFLRTVLIEDLTPPVLTLNGEETTYVEVYTDYNELGVTVTDNYDSSLTYQVDGFIDTNTIDTYELTYTATDSSGNSSTITRTVIVEDTLPPEILLSGEPIIELEVFNTYNDQGAEVIDNYDDSPDLTITSDVDVNTLGTYQVTYTATDLYNNTSTLVRTVNVVDKTPPTVTLLAGIDTIILDTTHLDTGVEAFDNYDQALIINPVSSVDETKEGRYSIIYEVTDQSGNTTFITRYVTVLTEQKPIVFAFSGGRVGYYLNDELSLPACEVQNTVCTVDASSINTSVEGLYIATYSVTVGGETYTKEIPILVYDVSQNQTAFFEKKRGMFL